MLYFIKYCTVNTSEQRTTLNFSVQCINKVINKVIIKHLVD